MLYSNTETVSRNVTLQHRGSFRECFTAARKAMVGVITDKNAATVEQD